MTPVGKRVMKEMMSGTEWYFYGIGGQKLLTKFCDGVHSCTTDYNVYFGGKLLKSKGAVVATDRLGSVRANANGETFRYYPYGEERTSTADNREKFGTYLRDSLTQDYADQRYYSVGMGRFGTPDPSSAVSVGSPYTWNRYAYVHGDPINFRDPSGLNEANPDGSCSAEFEDCGEWDWIYSGGVGGGGGGNGGGGNGFVYPSDPNPTVTAAERKKRQAEIEAAFSTIAASIADLARQRNKSATWPDFIQFISSCSTSGLTGPQLQVTYQVYDNTGHPMTFNLGDFTITESFFAQTGNMDDLNAQRGGVGIWKTSNNTLQSNGQFTDVLLSGFNQSGTALQEFTATGWFGTQPLGISFLGSSMLGVNFNTYSPTGQSVNGVGATAGSCH